MLCGINGRLLQKPQRVHNSAARVITQQRRRDHLHITPVLIALPWLPVPWRITYKILVLTFRTIHDLTFILTPLVTSPSGVVCIDSSCHLTSWCRLYRLILSPHLLVSFITTYLVTSPPGVVYNDLSCHLTSWCRL